MLLSATLHTNHGKNKPSDKIIWKYIVNGDLGNTYRYLRAQDVASGRDDGIKLDR